MNSSGSTQKAISLDFGALLSKIREFDKDQAGLIFTHRQADPDALCSAYAVSRLLSLDQKTLKQDSENEKAYWKIIAPQGASQLATRVCKALSIEFNEEIPLEEIQRAQVIICVDVGDKHLLEPYLEPIFKSDAKKFLLDHHSSREENEENSNSNSAFFDFGLTQCDATSTCEIIALGSSEKNIDEILARVLLVGLLFDSQHLGIATERTLEAAVRLVRKGASISQAKEILRSKPDRSENIARLKSSQRLRYQELGPYLLAETEVSSFQASVARMLIDIGADIGIAFGEQEGEVRISVRTTQRFERETKIDLGILLSKISKTLGIAGGGHSTAGSISGKGSSTWVKNDIVTELRKALP
jgi:bifunctional oligoribonuclease and PAP phosphatase NrnA